TKTNELARKLDPTRPTGGVRYSKKSELLEDVYTYNDFSHIGDNPGIEAKKKITSKMGSPYMVTEYNGHMFPTKSFDDESHRLSHALRHTSVLNDLYRHDDVLGGFGWCMFDYNTHKDFGSGDRICYHGVLDAFRNPKLAATAYSSQQEEKPVLEISSSMDVGEYAGSIRGEIYAFTNGDEVRLYKNDSLIKSFTREDNNLYPHLPMGPIVIDDFLGDLLDAETQFSVGQRKTLKKTLLVIAKFGPNNLPLKGLLLGAKLMGLYRMTVEEIGEYYTRYIGNWGQEATTYGFEALKAGKVIKRIEKKTMKAVDLEINVDRTILREGDTYDVATLRIKALSDSGNLLSYLMEPIELEVEGPIEIIGPSILTLRGGMTGTYIRSTGREGKGKLRLIMSGRKTWEVDFDVQIPKPNLEEVGGSH
ncbi:MAG TPA: glycoside hydrolase family 2 protein, partial [Treponema sp.]|nr:glycoside hydrolase family 2 protein [Treponema sp.]